MNIKALMKVLATWIGIALLVIAYLIDERSIIYFIAFIAFIAFSYFLYALYSGDLEDHERRGGRIKINQEPPKGERPHPRPNW
jgi:nitrogen fixation-related uncharacterized protein